MKAHFGLGAIGLVLAIFGLVIVTRPETLVNCNSLSVQNHVDLIVAVIAIAQLIEVCLKCCCCLVLAGTSADEESSLTLPTYEDTSFNLVEDRWKVRQDSSRPQYLHISAWLTKPLIISSSSSYNRTGAASCAHVHDTPLAICFLVVAG